MNPYLIEMILALAIWTAVGYAIWKWGPGLRRRWVRCPEKRTFATVLADQREIEFGCLRVADVKACSLIVVTPLTCDKQCLARF